MIHQNQPKNIWSHQNHKVRIKLRMPQYPPDPGITAKYEIVQKVGEGCYSDVFQARNTQTGEIVALKRIKTFSGGLPISFYRELRAYKNLMHPNILKMVDDPYKDSDNNLFLVLEFCESDLSTILRRRNRITVSDFRKYMKELMLSLKYLHHMNIAHRDLKPANALIDGNGTLKLTDFGLTRSLDTNQPMTTKVVTMNYRAPELFLNNAHYSLAIDIWSLGCMFYNLATGGENLFDCRKHDDISRLKSIFEICGSPNDESWSDFKMYPNSALFRNMKQKKSQLREILQQRLPSQYFCIIDLIEKMLSIDPKKRPTVDQILEHPFFNVVEESGFVPESAMTIGASNKASRFEKLKCIPDITSPNELRLPTISIGFEPVPVQADNLST